MAHITILGSGAWGTALGQILALNHTVTIWGRSSDKITSYAQSSQHSALKGVILSTKIHWTSCINTALEKAEIIILSIQSTPFWHRGHLLSLVSHFEIQFLWKFL